jgi:AAA15 family ATPase/GTPase
MAELLLNSLEIKNFRAFEHLKIEKLGRVNLIVGRNSIGKTALLETLWVYANQGTLNVLLSLLEQHKEFNFAAANEVSLKTANSQELIKSLEHLFYGVPNIKSLPLAYIGLLNDNRKQLSLELLSYSKAPSTEPSVNPGNGIFLFGRSKNISSLVVAYGDEIVADYGFNTSLQNLLSVATNTTQLPVNFLQTSDLSDNRISQLWDNVVVTDLEAKVMAMLQVVNPDIEKLAIIKNNDQQNIYIGFKNSNRRVTLASLGEGLNRVFQIALTLVNSENGLLLVNEIENGLYHGVQVDLWKLIFELAQQLNIQIFATTHSWDCVEAFQEAATEDANEEAQLISLRHINGQLVPIMYDERRMEIATRRGIEVR